MNTCKTMASRRSSSSLIVLVLALFFFLSGSVAPCCAAGLRQPQAFLQRKKHASSPLTNTSDDTNPSWSDILKRPIRVSTLGIWQSQSQSKRIAILIRPFALHLTVLSSLSPLIFNGALCKQMVHHHLLHPSLLPARRWRGRPA